MYIMKRINGFTKVWNVTKLTHHTSLDEGAQSYQGRKSIDRLHGGRKTTDLMSSGYNKELNLGTQNCFSAPRYPRL